MHHEVNLLFQVKYFLNQTYHCDESCGDSRSLGILEEDHVFLIVHPEHLVVISPENQEVGL